MKVKRLIIKNIGLIADSIIELNQPLILFYGDIMQGKTTILNAVKFCFGGAYPTDIIRHGETEAGVTLEFEGGSITREWYVGKDGLTHAREISFIRDGKPVKKPVKEIERFLNPFLLDQDYLRKMTELERKTYFTQLFAIDTSNLDMESFCLENDCRELRAKIKGYGDIDLTEVKPIDAKPLRADLMQIRAGHQEALNLISNTNREIIQFNQTIATAMDDLKEWDAEIQELTQRLAESKAKREELAVWIKANPTRKEKPMPIPVDTSALEARINEAAATEVKFEQYQRNIAKNKAKEDDASKLRELELKTREIKKQKIYRLSQISETCGIKDLVFDESGNFAYQGTTLGMLSGSQIMKLSEELSNLYPKDLGISLIDRAESLGKSIFEFVDRAQKEEKTILATIVGERPAKVPEHIGVFVVEKGEVKS